MTYPRTPITLILACILTFALIPSHLKAEVTLLIPAKPDILAPQSKKDQAKDKSSAIQPKKEMTKDAQKSPPAPQSSPQNNNPIPKDKGNLVQINEETDILISRIKAFAYTFSPMDMPQAFTVLRYSREKPMNNGHPQATRRDLLGDVEEILYKGQKAWGANVGIVEPGLYQFVLETRPWWDEVQQHFCQQYVKVLLPVYGDDTGWEEPSGQRFEIVPMTRPFGLLAPSLFTGKVLFDGHPCANCLVIIERINTDGQKVPTPWHQALVLRSDANGQFSAILNKAGWWCCRALLEGAPLKGADGHPKALQLGSLYWIYVDGNAVPAR
ncbi:MAG: DUF4198 domain-containing protein [Desulfovibrio sp.]|nr:DUF4198 domain-containing protein [Desulfovibrio sp.]